MSKAGVFSKGLFKAEGLYYLRDPSGNDLILEHMKSGKVTGFYIPLTGKVEVTNLNQKITISLENESITVSGLVVQRLHEDKVVLSMHFPSLQLSNGPKEHMRAIAKYLQSLA